MDIVSKEQWSGWFAGLGSGGVILQNVITYISPWIIAGLVIWFVFLISKLGAALSQASGPEQRKEVKIKLGLAILGLIIFVVGPTLILIFMNTIFKTVQVKSADESTSELIQIVTTNFLQFKNINMEGLNIVYLNNI